MSDGAVDRAATGIGGLDEALCGGLVRVRPGSHERTLRECRIASRGIEIGEPLPGFQGVPRGVPASLGTDNSPMADGAD